MESHGRDSEPDWARVSSALTSDVMGRTFLQDWIVDLRRKKKGPITQQNSATTIRKLCSLFYEAILRKQNQIESSTQVTQPRLELCSF